VPRIEIETVMSLHCSNISANSFGIPFVIKGKKPFRNGAKHFTFSDNLLFQKQNYFTVKTGETKPVWPHNNLLKKKIKGYRVPGLNLAPPFFPLLRPPRKFYVIPALFSPLFGQSMSRLWYALYFLHFTN